MEAKELMIGNYVKDPYGKIIKLVSVEKDASMLKPIPLTEDWLLKFGFKKGNNNFGNIYEKLFNFSIYTFSEANDKVKHSAFGVRSIDNEYGDVDILRNFTWDLKYIHQIQNLYFSLTGEELKRTTPSKTLEQ